MPDNEKEERARSLESFLEGLDRQSAVLENISQAIARLELTASWVLPPMKQISAVDARKQLQNASYTGYEILGGDSGLSMTSARTNERFAVQGDSLAVATDGNLAGVTIRLNRRDAHAIPLRYFNPWPGQFHEVYVTHTAQAGKTLYVIAHRDIFGLLRIGDGRTRLVTAVGDEVTNDILDAIKTTGKDLVLVTAKLFEWTSPTWIASQTLTVDGVQLSDEKTQAVGGAETQVFGAIYEPPESGTLVAVELGLLCQLKSGEATVNKTWQWKARNKDGTWVNLHDAVSEALTTAYVEKPRSGYFYGVTNFNQVPFEVGLFCTPHATTALATIISQVKNSCYATAIYKPS